MKRLFSLLCAGAFVLAAASSALAQPGTIEGSPHDFRDQTWAGNTGTTSTLNGDFCTVCHTPHNGGTEAPLWDHALPSDLSATTGFTMYTSATSSTFDATDPTAVTGSSAVCLGCHDGQTALNAYGGSAGDTDMATEYPSSTANFGTDLSNDHPISINYQSAITNGDPELAAATDPLVEPMLRGGLVQCASCHDPHGVPSLPFFTRYDNTGSAMCIRCHRK